jgi:hypothetical protein
MTQLSKLIRTLLLEKLQPLFDEHNEKSTNIVYGAPTMAKSAVKSAFVSAFMQTIEESKPKENQTDDHAAISAALHGLAMAVNRMPDDMLSIVFPICMDISDMISDYHKHTPQPDTLLTTLYTVTDALKGRMNAIQQSIRSN